MNADSGSAVEKMRTYFFVPPDVGSFMAEVNQLASGAELPMAEIARAFAHNVSAVISTVSIPFTLASTSVHRQHYWRFGTAERIRARMIEQEENETEEALERRRDAHAGKRADERMQEFLATSDGTNTVTEDICHFLLSGFKEQGGADAASELLHQGVVLLWGAFEVLARDIFQQYVNVNPKALQRLLSDASTRKRFEQQKFSVEFLAEHGFDVSAKMGTILANQQDLSDLLTIKAVYLALFPNNEAIRQSLNERGLWMLSQQRHLIVHRRAVVDQRYVEATNTTCLVGTRLMITPRDLVDYLKLVCQAGTTLISATSENLKG